MTEGSLQESPSYLMSPRSRLEGRNLGINASSGKRRLNLAASEPCRSLRQRRRCCTFRDARLTLSFSTRRDLSLNSILMVRVCLAIFCCGVTVASALAQTNSQFPVSTNLRETGVDPTNVPAHHTRKPLLDYSALAFSHAISQADPASGWHNASAFTGDAHASPSGRQHALRGAQPTHTRSQSVLGAADETRRMAILPSNRPAVANSGADPFSCPHPHPISSIELTVSGWS